MTEGACRGRAEPNEDEAKNMPQGTIKDYDTRTHTGVLLLDDESEVHIDAVSMEGSGLRYLRIGQRVKFDVVDEDGRRLARTLRHITFD